MIVSYLRALGEGKMGSSFSTGISITLSLLAFILLPAPSAWSIENLRVGQDERPWRGGGGGEKPRYKESDISLVVGNTPGDVINFNYTPGWIFPEEIDPATNLAQEAPKRGGGIKSPQTIISQASLDPIIDGNPGTAFRRKANFEGEVVFSRGIIIQLDLGARFGVNRIRFFPRNTVYPAPEQAFQNDFLRAFEMQLNDGSEESFVGGRPVFSPFRTVEDNTDQVVDLTFPLRFVRNIQLKSLSNIGFEIDEIEVFGGGFVPSAQFLSDVFDLAEVVPGDIANFGSIRWVEEREGLPDFSRIRLVTRSGIDKNPWVFNRRRGLDGEQVPWEEDAEVNNARLDALDIQEAFALYNAQPLEVREEMTLTQTDYENLGASQQAPIKEDLINWSSWSPPYSQAASREGGVANQSPGPRRFFQFRIDLLSDRLDAAPGLDFVSFELSSPVPARQIIAEVFPRDVRAGEVVEFTYGARAKVLPADSGFDRFEISTPSRFEAVTRIEILNVDGESQDLFADFEVELDSAALPIEKEGFSIQSVDEGSLVVGFPKITEESVLLVKFKTSVLRFGQIFSGRGFVEGSSELPQGVIPGNAADLEDGDFDLRPHGSVDLNTVDNNLSVRIEIEGTLLGQVRSEPGTFTPNGDGINDFTTINFDVFRLGVGAPLRIEIFDLSGRPVAVPFEAIKTSGRFSTRWDGRGANGKLLPPGIYLFRVFLDTNEGAESKSGLVSVVY